MFSLCSIAATMNRSDDQGFRFVIKMALRNALRLVRGLSREESAMYIGVSAGKFDEMIKDGRMPGPRRIDARRIWDIRALDSAFDDLPFENAPAGNSWDDY
jgi:hypothetical protein